MIADQNSSVFHRAKNSLSIVAVPIQYAVSWPIDFIDTMSNALSSKESLEKENTDLHAKLLLLQSQLQKQYAIEEENTQLKALLQSSSQAGGRVSEAQILAVAPDPFVRQVIINEGEKDGVYVGQPVLDSSGVLGQVIQVGAMSSRVLLITDPQSAVPVQLSRNGLRAIAVGDTTFDLLKLENITETTDIQPGDLLVTSGLGQHFPFGYPVGTVISVTHGPGEQFADITVQPSAHINRSRLVLLVWPMKTVIDEPVKQALTGSKQTVKS